MWCLTCERKQVTQRDVQRTQQHNHITHTHTHTRTWSCRWWKKEYQLTSLDEWSTEMMWAETTVQNENWTLLTDDWDCSWTWERGSGKIELDACGSTEPQQETLECENVVGQPIVTKSIAKSFHLIFKKCYWAHMFWHVPVILVFLNRVVQGKAAQAGPHWISQQLVDG